MVRRNAPIARSILFVFAIVSTGVIYSQESRDNLREFTNHGQDLKPVIRAGIAHLRTFPFNRRGEQPNAKSRSAPAVIGKRVQIGELRPSRTEAEINVIDTATVISTYDTTRYIYAHNSAGSIISESVKKLANSQWVDSCRNTYTYDASGDRLTELHQEWTDGQWVNVDSARYTYDANGNNLTALDIQWTNNKWTNVDSTAFTYDKSGRFLSLQAEQWTNGQWVNSYRITDGYDTNGLWVSWSDEEWTNSQWVNNIIETYTYNASGKMLSALQEQWTDGQWMYTWCDSLTYNANGQLVIGLWEEWANGQWVRDDSSMYTYDANGRTLTELNKYWMNSQWVKHDSATYYYDANGNTLTELYEEWMGGEWMNGWRYTYTYGSNGLRTTGKYEVWQDSLWTPADEDLDFSDSTGNYFDYSASYVSVTYELITTGVVTSNAGIPSRYSLSQNYPNPFNPTTTISFSLPTKSFVSMEVFDLLGRKVTTLVSDELPAGNYSRQWNAANMSSGVYFYRLQAGTYSETMKLLLLR